MTTITPKQRRRRRIVLALSALLSLAGLLVLVSRLDINEVGSALAATDYGYFLLSLLLVTLVQIVPAWRWCTLLENRISLSHSFSATMVGNFASGFLPLRAGEAVKAGLIYRSERLSLAQSIPSILLGQLLDVFGILVLGLLLLLIAPLPETLVQATLILTGLSIAAVVGLLLLWMLLARTAQTNLTVVACTSRRIIDSLRTLKNPGQVALVAVQTLVFWGGVSLSASVLLAGSGVDQILVGGVMMGFTGGIGRMLPALPGSIGTLDAAVLLGLTALGIGEDIALALVILLRVRYTIMIIVTGLIGFIMEGRSLPPTEEMVQV